MCPAMTAGPVAPGGGLRSYQPATSNRSGTWRVPDGVRPSRMSGVLTAMAGMVSATGAATGADAADVADELFGVRRVGVAAVTALVFRIGAGRLWEAVARATEPQAITGRP